MNLCRSCGQDFASVSAFDLHRVGKHAITYAEGLRMQPAREDGRRCLDEDELGAAGMELDQRDRWRRPPDLERLGKLKGRVEKASQVLRGPSAIAETLR